jgi:NAD dependent epimerase/dehydratase family enzyme
LDIRAFSAAMGRALGRPAWFPVPAPVLRLAVGELADAALLQGQALSVEKLVYSGFHFLHPDIDAALEELLDNEGEDTAN